MTKKPRSKPGKPPPWASNPPASPVSNTLLSYGMGGGAKFSAQLQRSEPRILAEATQSVEAGDLDRAERLLGELLKRNATHPLALHELGRIANRRGDPARAANLIGRAIEAAPDQAIFHINLGNALERMGQSDAAIDAFAKGAALAPELPEAQYNHGLALWNAGRSPQAAKAYRAALEARPDYVRALIALSAIHQSFGETNEAEALLDRVRTVEPENLEAIAMHAGLKPATAGAADFDLLERVRSDEKRPAAHRRLACFTLSKMYDDIGEYGRAFAAAEEANATRLAMANITPADIDLSGFTAYVDRVIELVDRPSLEMDSGGDTSERPVFIVGMPHSGTSLVEQTLANHPEVLAAGEVPWLEQVKRQAEQDAGTAYPDSAPGLAGDRAAVYGAAYMERARGLDAASRYFTDSASMNFQFLGLIARILPQSRVVHCIRDPRDTCLSCFMVDFPGGLWFASDMDALARFYREYERLMDHWRSVLPLAMMEIFHEDLMTDPQTEGQALMEFCDLPRDTASSATPKGTTGAAARGPQWKNYADQIGPLVDAFGRD